jgi:hypothetical protein
MSAKMLIMDQIGDENNLKEEEIEDMYKRMMDE